ncbi:Na+/H+ antiporter subunit G [Anaerolineae bacterium CFX9]|jgi:multicomponent Na+:H+ antiporter subunit G|nr:Na+/H+ antiporter subunit G [Anaerolineae bacterium CFX9]
MTFSEILALGFMIFGLFFSVVGVIGLLRFPDVYTRIHSSGKVSTLGIFGVLVSTAFLLEGAAPKVLALAIFVLVTSPVTAHAIASAAYRQGVPLFKPVRDDLAAHHTRSQTQPADEEHLNT